MKLIILLVAVASLTGCAASQKEKQAIEASLIKLESAQVALKKAREKHLALEYQLENQRIQQLGKNGWVVCEKSRNYTACK